MYSLKRECAPHGLFSGDFPNLSASCVYLAMAGSVGERCVYCQSVFIAKQLDDEQKDLDLESWAVCCVLLYLPASQNRRSMN